MNGYRVCLSHVLGILAHANARTASLPSSLACICFCTYGRNNWIPGTWTRHPTQCWLVLVGKGMGGDILGGLGDRYPCQHVPTILVAGLVSHGQLNPSNMVALLSRERKREETPGVGMWPRQPKKSSACGVLTPAGTRRNKRRVVWDVGAGVDGWHGCLPMPPWLPPTGSARLVSSRRHRPLPTFPLPFPAGSRFQQTQRPRKTQSLRDQSRILPIGCPWRSPSSLVVGFIGLLVTLLPPNPFFSFFSNSPPPVASRLSEALHW